jgi:predicted anti-sigma-YlaC factor YlaD
MKCDKVRDILITDYIDGEASQSVCVEIEKHLKACKNCKEFYATVKKEAVLPFAGAEDIAPPEEVWNNIKVRITQERQTFDVIGALNSFKERFFIPKPALAMVSLLLFIVIGLSGIKYYQVHNYNLVKN